MNDMAQDLARLALDGAVTEPAVLENLRAAGLASHAAQGGASESSGETAALRALCDLVSGPIYRLDPFHYAFRLEVEDVDGALARMAPALWAGALEASLLRAGTSLEVQALEPGEADLGLPGDLASAEDAPVGEDHAAEVVTPVDPGSGDAEGERFEEAVPLWLLRSWDDAVAAGVLRALACRR